MQVSLDMLIKQENWKQSAIAANNLSELLLTLGDVNRAVVYARQGVEYADRSGDEFEKYSDRTTLADALHQVGQLKEAEKLFLQAEAMQKKRQPQYPYLYSLQGYRFCDLMLGRGRYKEALTRAEKALEIVLNGSRNLLDIALNHLAIGRAWLLNGLDPENKKNKEREDAMSHAGEYLDRAVDGLRKAGYQEFLIKGLLARAGYYRVRRQYDLAEQDLAEALEIAELGSMKLYLVDYHIESGRLRRAQGRDEEAKQHFHQASALIEETGYHRRDQEIIL
jgi:tetratricopeptide (TPR) repeat protein